MRFLLLALAALPVFAANHTALDRYVAAPDPNFKYELARTSTGRGYTQYVYDMISRKWRTKRDIVPDRVEQTTGFLYLTGGSINADSPEQPDALIASVATSTNTMAAGLRDIPNEPLLFAGETKPRAEDAAIVYTWDKFLKGADETWPLRLPMTKAALRAMDTGLCSSENQRPYRRPLRSFGSLETRLDHMDNSRCRQNGSDARETALAFYTTIVNNEPRPKMDWTFEKDGSIHMKTTAKPTQVVMWQANNPKARDFRLDSIGKAYMSTIPDEGGGLFIAKIDKPDPGYTAFFIEATFPTKNSQLNLTSGVRITPDTLPSGPPTHTKY